MVWVIKGVAEGLSPATPMEGILGDCLMECDHCRARRFYVNYRGCFQGYDNWRILCASCNDEFDVSIHRLVGENGAWEGTEEKCDDAD